MALFPKIDMACPYKDTLDTFMKDEFCAKCEKTVLDLTHLTDETRQQRLSACSGEVCVTYRIPVKRLVASAAIALMGLPVLAAAQDAPEQAVSDDELYYFSDEDVIIVGAVRDTNEVLWIDIEAEQYMTHIPETEDLVDNKKDALLLFALNGLTDDDNKEDAPLGQATADPDSNLQD